MATISNSSFVEQECGDIPKRLQIGPEKYGFIYEMMPGDSIAWQCCRGSEYANPGERLLLAIAPAVDEVDGKDHERVYVQMCVRMWVCM